MFFDCTAEDCSATLVEIANELGNLLFNQLITFSVLPSTFSYSGSLGDLAYWKKEQCISIQGLAKFDLAIRKPPTLVLFSPFCSKLKFSTSNRVPQIVLHKTKS
ncbi:hypothetical protein H5410_001622 [Solanum commersonii]|uniref:Uncharacterized protein n=1 Tax=Solanum commersonii TaxID=4109 RepID=A0A9J6AZQ0_SOLCO|nr:hypothetical protein H5410_001622 [Solanum commersonii]